jgi:hypothetical protein
MMERARDVLTDWVNGHPADTDAKKMMEDFDQMLREGSSSRP